jgi:AcrR family transcriptional regulator
MYDETLSARIAFPGQNRANMSPIEQNQRSVSEWTETANRSIDRRAARTRGMLHRALLHLILEKGFEAISVGEICKSANIGRSTFYAHFASKDDLKRSSLKHLRRQLLERYRSASATARPGTGQLAFSLVMFEHAHEHVQLSRALVGSKGSAVALGIVRETLCEFLRGELPTDDSKDANRAPREVVIQHIVGAYIAVLTWWLDGGAKLPPQRIDAIFRRLILEGL